MQIDYCVKNRKYSLDGGRLLTPKAAYHALRKAGYDHEEAGLLLRANKLVAEIEARHPEIQADDYCTPAEASEILTACGRIARKAFVIDAATKYVKENLQASKNKCPRSIYSLKHDCERGLHVYLRESEYSEALRSCGLKVTPDGRVFAKEKRDA